MPEPIDPTERGGPTLDPTVLAELREALGDDLLVAEIIGAFQAETPGQIASLVAAHDRGDSHALVSAAHLIRGGALTLGADRMAGLCAALEASPDGSPRLVPAVADEFDELTGALSAYLSAVLPRG